MYLDDIAGIGDTKIERLEEAGYEFAEDVAYANLSEITELEGINHDVVKNAQKLIGVDEKILDPQNMKYHCGQCGKPFRGTSRTPFVVHENNCTDEHWSPRRMERY